MPLVRDDERLRAFLTGREPMATHLLAPLLSDRRTRSRLVVDRGGRPTGAVVLDRVARGRRVGLVIMDDPAEAPAVARFLERGQVWSVGGPARSVLALRPHLARMTEPDLMWASDFPPIPVDQHDTMAEQLAIDLTPPGVRPARVEDLDALVGLYAPSIFLALHSRPSLRRLLLQRIRGEALFVKEEDGGVVGAIAFTGRTPRYCILDELVVAEGHKGEGIGHQLSVVAIQAAMRQGLGLCSIRATSNGARPHEVPEDSSVDVEDLYSRGVWAGAFCRPPSRFPGHTRLRRVLRGLEGRLPTTPYGRSEHADAPTTADLDGGGGDGA